MNLGRGVHGLGWVGFRAGWFGLTNLFGGLGWVGLKKIIESTKTNPNQTVAGWFRLGWRVGPY